MGSGERWPQPSNGDRPARRLASEGKEPVTPAGFKSGSTPQGLGIARDREGFQEGATPEASDG